MDLGIRGKKAIVCASSKGLGKACAEFLAADGVDLVMVARGAETPEQTAAEIRPGPNVNVTAIATDIPTPAGRHAAAKARNPSVDDIRAHRSEENPAGRIGDPAEFGAACAFLCSVHAGFMTGQNILLDGGAFRGTM